MIDHRFILPGDVRIEALASLPEEILATFEHGDHDWAVTRPRSRVPTHIINDDTTRLLQLFREPTTIVDAIVGFSQSGGGDARETLDHAFPILQMFIEAGLLVPSDSSLAPEIEYSLARGEAVGEMTVDEPVAILADTELYRVTLPGSGCAALKIGRPGAERQLGTALTHEAAVLARLDGTCNAALLAQGEYCGRPYLAIEWCHGVDAFTAAQLVRDQGVAGQHELGQILLSIAQAYARLHEQQVVHGDVHPRNLLIGESGKAVLIDFGQAHDLGQGGSTTRAGRGVVDLYMEPELARARLNGLPSPPPTAAGEQYSLAALLYYLVMGSHTHDFVLEEQQMLRQILDDAPIGFAERGVPDFPQTERVLLRALEKDPQARFPSLRAFRRSLQHAIDLDRTAPLPHRPITRAARPGDLIGDFIERAGLDGRLLPEGLPAPCASVTFGGAGIAFALLRLAQRRQDEVLLALADIWIETAIQQMALSEERAFSAADLELALDVVGKTSLYHSVPGIYCVAALVADAQASGDRRKRSVERFAAAASQAEERMELVFGRAGSLLGCALLLDAFATAASDERTLLFKAGQQLCDGILDRLADLPDVKDAVGLTSLGMAHGWSGILYSVLLWWKASRTPPSAEIHARMEQLAALAQPAGRGLVWPVATNHRAGSSGLQASWCNGAAGHLHLWLSAHECFGERHYLSLARGAAWTAFEAAASGGDLCCGAAGRAYALLSFYRQDGDPLWLERARGLGDRAADVIPKRHLRKDSLYRGEAGVCLLAEDLVAPEQARMPLFELQ